MFLFKSDHKRIIPPIILNKINLKVLVHQHSECASLDNKVLAYKTKKHSSGNSNEHEKCVLETTLLFPYAPISLRRHLTLYLTD
jgi:hypothetical protein